MARLYTRGITRGGVLMLFPFEVSSKEPPLWYVADIEAEHFVEATDKLGKDFIKRVEYAIEYMEKRKKQGGIKNNE